MWFLFWFSSRCEKNLARQALSPTRFLVWPPQDTNLNSPGSCIDSTSHPWKPSRPPDSISILYVFLCRRSLNGWIFTSVLLGSSAWMANSKLSFFFLFQVFFFVFLFFFYYPISPLSRPPRGYRFAKKSIEGNGLCPQFHIECIYFGWPSFAFQLLLSFSLLNNYIYFFIRCLR